MNCPICGSKGEDLIFNFYCSNPSCQNFQDKNKSISEPQGAKCAPRTISDEFIQECKKYIDWSLLKI